MILFWLEVEDRVFLFVPDVTCFKHIDRAFAIATINLKAITLFFIEALDPNTGFECRLALDRAELVDFLEFNKPRVQKQISCFVYPPNAHWVVSAWSDKELYFLKVDHVKDGSLVTDDRLKAAALCFLIHWLPQFNRGICAATNQNFETLDSRED